MSGGPDEVVRAYVMHLFRTGEGDYQSQTGYAHLRQCPDAGVDGEHKASNGYYGCETGCEYARLEARIVCPHGAVDFEYGTFGDISDLLRDLNRWSLTRSAPPETGSP